MNSNTFRILGNFPTAQGTIIVTESITKVGRMMGTSNVFANPGRLWSRVQFPLSGAGIPQMAPAIECTIRIAPDQVAELTPPRETVWQIGTQNTRLVARVKSL